MHAGSRAPRRLHACGFSHCSTTAWVEMGSNGGRHTRTIRRARSAFQVLCGLARMPGKRSDVRLGMLLLAQLLAAAYLACPCAAADVASASELAESIKRGDVHIRVVEHLNVDSVEGTATARGTQRNVFEFEPSSKSLRGACSSPYEQAEALPWGLTPGQCHLLLPWGIAFIVQSNCAVWIDNLYLQDGPKPPDAAAMFADGLRKPSLMVQVWPGAIAWLTHLTMEGAGQLSNALEVHETNSSPDMARFYSGKAYVADCMIAQFNSPAGFIGPVYVGGYLTMRRTTLALNVVHEKTTGVIEVRTPQNTTMGYYAIADLQRVKFASNDAVALVEKQGLRAIVASDNPEQPVRWTRNNETTPGSLDFIPLDQRTFMPTDMDEGFQLALQATGGLPPPATWGLPPLEPPPAALPPPVPTRQSNSCGPNGPPCGATGGHRGIILGSVLGTFGTALVLSAGMLVLIIMLRRKPSRSLAPSSIGSQRRLGRHLLSGVSSLLSNPDNTVRLDAFPSFLQFNRRAQSALIETFTYVAPPEHSHRAGPNVRRGRQPELDPVAATATSEFLEGAAGIEGALDELQRTGTAFLGKYVLGTRGVLDRRVGGQGVVQFASRVRPHEEVVIKFFLHKNAFDAEAKLYQQTELRDMMPATKEIVDNADGAIVSQNGYRFPPCIVIERGQSLVEFSNNVRTADGAIQHLNIVQCIMFIADRLAQLHACGFVHRDIKPQNILRLPARNQWTLIDFGSTVPAGQVALLSFTPTYAPPEVITAFECGTKRLKAAKSMDVWSLGVVAYEMLTGKPAVSRTDMSEAMARIAGRLPLPWEQDPPGPHSSLGRLRRTILRCLNRHPMRRPSAQEILSTWDTIFKAESNRITPGPITV